MNILLSFTVFGIFTFLIYLYIARKNNRQTKRPPKAAGAWPIIGHLHLLGGPQLPHKTLGAMADNYGPIFTINVGLHQVVVISDMTIAKQCFTTNDKVFANRPKAVAVELMGYNYAIFGLTPYGPYWRHVRKMVNNDLLSHRQVEVLGHVRVSEVKASIGEMHELWVKNKNGEGKVKMEMKQWFSGLVMNMVVRMLVGRRYLGGDEEGVRTQAAVRRFVELLGGFVVADAIPFVRWLDLGGQERVMKETAAEMDGIVEGWLEEHKRKRSGGEVEGGRGLDFMDVMLANLEGASAEDLGGYDVDTVVKSTCLALLAGAADTTIVTLTWALSLLLNNPHVLKMAQDEIDIHVGRDRQVEESDMKNLVYLQAIFKETLRLYPAVPLSVPHESMEDCMVGGYNIPKGTRLVTNLWKIHRDPSVWSDPSEYRPERFMTSYKDVDIKGQNFELIPFGSGRRMCPGIILAIEVVQLTLASLIHGFEVTKLLDEPIDMSESFGMTNLKTTPLEVLLKPRQSPNLYEQIIV